MIGAGGVVRVQVSTQLSSPASVAVAVRECLRPVAMVENRTPLPFLLCQKPGDHWLEVPPLAAVGLTWGASAGEDGEAGYRVWLQAEAHPEVEPPSTPPQGRLFVVEPLATSRKARGEAEGDDAKPPLQELGWLPAMGTNGQAGRVLVIHMEEDGVEVLVLSADPSVCGGQLAAAGGAGRHRELALHRAEWHFVVDIADLTLSVVDAAPAEVCANGGHVACCIAGSARCGGCHAWAKHVQLLSASAELATAPSEDTSFCARGYQPSACGVLLASLTGLLLEVSTGLAGGMSSCSLRVDDLQIDDQNTFSAFPVVFARGETSKSGSRKRMPLLEVAVSQKAGLQGGAKLYPCITSNLCEEGVVVQVHEALVWRLHAMIKSLNLSRLSSQPDATSVAASLPLQIGVMSISRIRMKLSFHLAPESRPRGGLGSAMWAVMLALPNVEGAALSLPAFLEENLFTRQQVFEQQMREHFTQRVSLALNVLRSYAVLEGVGGVFGHMGAGLAALSFDKQFVQKRKQRSNQQLMGDHRKHDRVKDAMLDGSEALAKGVFRGVTGLVTKPYEGARERGAEGFAKGLGKGIIGVVTQPTSGALDLVSQATVGVSAAMDKAMYTAKAVLLSAHDTNRRRLPRAIKGDLRLREYRKRDAAGQHALRLAQYGTYFGQGLDLWQTRGKYSQTDHYEGHMELPGDQMLVLTNKRALLLSPPSGRSGEELSKPRSVVWAVDWANLLAVEISAPVTPREDRRRLSGPYNKFEFIDRQELEDASTPPRQLGDETPSRPQAGSDGDNGDPSVLFIIHLKRPPPDRRILDSKHIHQEVKCARSQAAALRKMLAQCRSRCSAPQHHRLSPGSTSATGSCRHLAPRSPTDSLGSRCPALGTAPEGSEASSQVPRLPGGEPAMRCRGFIRVWTSQGVDGGGGSGGLLRKAAACTPISIWRPLVEEDAVPLGDVAVSGYNAPPESVQVCSLADKSVVHPMGFDLVWRDTKSGAQHPVTIWWPRAPPGAVALGCIAVAGNEEPLPEACACLVKAATTSAAMSQDPLWKDAAKSDAWSRCSIWQSHNQACTFVAWRNHERPPASLAREMVPFTA
ncbi:hypothetical protein CYMTET_18563 [Cymbomonas tetramitiformis]|uniref:Intermembrane lipid transfer protein VPS13-like C-terminal domain-containing protein n=1 Tax=Cymbomonas tetramitiformis TaxID=36881 RepID=A0AAE0G7Q9_9CHLO|nr:hypothetical protein CYMTET_18563 [Cymbomonas tetramitiformis]